MLSGLALFRLPGGLPFLGLPPASGAASATSGALGVLVGSPLLAGWAQLLREVEACLGPSAAGGHHSASFL